MSIVSFPTQRGREKNSLELLRSFLIVHVGLVNPAFEEWIEIEEKATDTGSEFSLFDSKLTT